MSSCACRLTAMTEFQRAASMLTSSLSRVMPALWTTMSTPPCRSRRCSISRCGASSAVMSSWSAVPPISLATAASESPAAGMSTATTWAPSRAMTFAIAAPMPAGRPGDDGDLAGQRPARRPRRSGTSAADSVTTWPST